jgi:hypothetical protein
MASSKPPKKSSGGSPRSYSEIYKSSSSAPAVQTSAAASASKSAAKAAPVLSTSDSVDWWGEYGYVLNDLKYLGLVTVGLLVAIVVVGFFM